MHKLLGIPTGGSLCEQIANIAVYYYMIKVVCSDDQLMKNVSTVKRYIDDGAGILMEQKYSSQNLSLMSTLDSVKWVVI